MSEINSIANGTYVIGQTSATNFIAGPGITISEPTAGTVRIGNDEMVLYSATPYAYGGDSSGASFQLSENISAFEKAAFYVNVRKGNDGYTYYDSQVIDNPFGNDYMAFQYGPYPENNATANWFILRAFISGTTCNVSAAYNNYTATQQPYWGNKWFPGSLYKIVGINRKEV